MDQRPTSLGDALRQSAARFPDRSAISFHAEGGRKGDGFASLTYTQLLEKTRQFSGALRELGLVRGDRLAILSENCPEWAFADWGALSLGIEVVPIYPTLPPDQAQYIVRDCGAKVALAGDAAQAAKLVSLPDLQVLQLRGGGSLDEMAKTGSISKEEWNAEIDKTGPENVATIIYTSGTTGLPKGAMIPHRAGLHVVHAASDLIHLDENDRFLSFLPMSHVYERIVGQWLPIVIGANIAFAKSLKSLAGDMLIAKPTILLCVPRFLEQFRDTAIEGSQKLPGLQRKLFDLAMSQGTRRARGKFAPLAGILDSLVGKKVRARVGGELRFFVSGGAGLPQHVAEFYLSMGFVVLQGYGLTETTGGTCINPIEDNRYWTVGYPMDMDVKIAEDGEILVRGGGLMLGYYNLPEETAQAIDRDGYFHTGDIGEFEGKSLKITDRKKDLLVLGNGKNIAPQPIENKLKASPLIAEAVVLGDGMEYCVALLVPRLDAVNAKLKAEGKPAAVEGSLGDNADVRALLKSEVDVVNKTLANFEFVKKFAVLEKPFTIDNGELTPTLKVKRKVVKERYADKIAALRQ